MKLNDKALDKAYNLANDGKIRSARLIYKNMPESSKKDELGGYLDRLELLREN